MERLNYRNLAKNLILEMHDELSSCSDARAREICVLISTLFQLERSGRLEGYLSSEGARSSDDPIYVVALGLLANHLTRPKNEVGPVGGDPG